MPIATQRRQPTFSPSTGPDRAATSKRVAGEDRVGFDQPENDEGLHRHDDLGVSSRPREICSTGCALRAAARMPPGWRAASATTKSAKNQ